MIQQYFKLKISVMRSLILLFLLSSGIIQAQNHSYYNEFFDNSFYNTAYNSLQKGFKLSALGYKNLNAPYTPGYICLNGSYTSSSLLNFSARIINKHFQFQSYYQADMIIGHRVALTQNDSIALSLNVGMATNSFDTKFLNQYTEVDPYIDVYNKSYFTAGSGLVYTHKNLLEVGVSAPVLANTIDGLKPIMYSNIAYNYRNNDFLFRPQIIFQTSSYANFFDFSGQLRYKDFIWGKVSYNTLKSSMFGVGINYKLLDIGYAYKLNSGGYGENLQGLHFLMVAIRH